MKKLLLPLILCLLATSSWSQADVRKIKTIPCSIEPIERAKIHPLDSYSAAPSISSNWSGYATTSTNKTVTQASGNWIVPTLKATPNSSYCAIWVGIDGYSSRTVEQIGTSHNWINGKVQHSAWFEMFPDGAYQIVGFPLTSGDTISAKVTYIGSNTFQLNIVNLTQKVSAVIPRRYTRSATALRNSAEWIVEAPFYKKVLPLADFQSAFLTKCSAIIRGRKGSITAFGSASHEIIMQAGDQEKASPLHLSSNGSSFEVAWLSE